MHGLAVRPARPGALTVTARPVLPPVSRPGDAREAEARASSANPPARFDLSRLKIHADEDADRMARAVGARAFTVRDEVFFRRGELDATSPDGRRLLAHELAHVAQDNDDALHRVPGQDAPDSWRAIAPDPIVFNPDQPERRGPVQEAVNRLLRLAEGARLVNQLWHVFCGGRSACRSRVRITFVDSDRRLDTGDSASGHFSPDAPNEPVYEILVRYRAPLSPEVRNRTLGGSWPGGTTQDIHYTHADSESDMANTLFHELLHVWFLHAHPNAHYPTGHGNVQKGQIEPVFMDRLRAFSRELDELEATLRRQAAPQQEPATPRSADVPDLPAERPSGPRLVGGELSLHGGPASGPGGSRVAGIVGADLILGNIHSLRLGARGIYLTPQSLLVGGTVGYRILGTEGSRIGERAERPFFFDLEAGVLTELTPDQTQRVSNGLVGVGAIGAGQEFGTSGPRFFWRVGAMVLISDRDVRSPAAVGTLGAGIRF